MKSEIREKVLECLLLHRDQQLSLEDIQRATELEKEPILEVMANLAQEGILAYKLDLKNPRTQRILDEYLERISDNFQRAHLRSIYKR